MEVKFAVCLSVVLVVCSVFSFCECEPERKNSVSKYNQEISKEGEEYKEEIEVDTEKQTEAFRLQKTSSGEATDIIYDLKKKQTMIRLPSACFLYKSVENVPDPAELVQWLDKRDDNKAIGTSTKVDLKVTSVFNDRFQLSDKMALTCHKVPIFHVVKANRVAHRAKRFLGSVGRIVCRKVCNYFLDKYNIRRCVCYKIC